MSREEDAKGGADPINRINLNRQIQQMFDAERAEQRRKIIVLDDDPTGVQTVHGVNVYTGCSRESLREAFVEDKDIFYILTNSRSLSRDASRALHEEIAENILSEANCDFILISRSDSTLRGHYPAETEALARVLRQHGRTVDGEVIYPFFPEGGRITSRNIHYVSAGGVLQPVGETEYARDKTFGYESSDLTHWIEEKTGGSYRSGGVCAISLEELKGQDYDGITQKLNQVVSFGKVVVNSTTYEDVTVFATAFLRSLKQGKYFIVRSAAAFVRVIGGIRPRPLLSADELILGQNNNGGLIIIGSHVNKTTLQVEKLKERNDVSFIEFNQHLVVDPPAFETEAVRVRELVDRRISEGITVAVYTRRERFDLNTGNKEDELRCAAEISDKLTSVVRYLTNRPSFIIAKGGITSSDVGTKGLGVRKALVMGQISPGIPVWLTNEASRFPNLPYIIFPGNVGEADTLRNIVAKLKGEAEE